MKKDKKNLGYTLVEMLVNIAVLSVIILGILSYFDWQNSVFMKTRSMWKVLNDMNRAIESIVFEIKESNSIYYPTSSDTQLSLLTPKFAPDGEELTYSDIYLCDTRICLKREEQDPLYLTSDEVSVTSLVFTQISTSTKATIGLSIEMTYGAFDNKKEDYTLNMSTTASLRSY